MGTRTSSCRIAMAADVRMIGMNSLEQLRDCDAYELYVMLCAKTEQRQDPCVIDVFLSIVHFTRRRNKAVAEIYRGAEKIIGRSGIGR